MNIVLWVLQGLLAVMFLMAGFMKATKSKDELKKTSGERMAWVDSVSDSNFRLIGIQYLDQKLGKERFLV